MHNHKKAVWKSTVKAPRGLPTKLEPFWEFAVEHSAADHRCGRTWQCACGPCNVIRKEIKRRNNMEPNKGNAWMLGFEMQRVLGELAASNP